MLSSISSGLVVVVVAARTGREFECESERRRDSRESAKCFVNKLVFANRFASIVGVRIACPLRLEESKTEALQFGGYVPQGSA